MLRAGCGFALALVAFAGPCDPKYEVPGEYRLFVPSALEECWETTGGTSSPEEISELLTAVEQMLEFYPGTDMAESTDQSVVGRVNLAEKIAQLRNNPPQSRYRFHKGVSRLVSDLKDNHAVYAMPSNFRGTLIHLMQLTSEMQDGQQRLLVYDFSALADNYWPDRNPELRVGSVITSIEGQEPITFMANWASENDGFKTADQALNNLFRLPATRIGIRGEVLKDSMNITFENTPGESRTAVVPFYAATPITVQSSGTARQPSNNIFGQTWEGVPRPEDIGHTFRKRSAQSLAAKDYWDLDGVDVLAYTPDLVQPDILCARSVSNDIPHMYLYVGTFSFDLSDPSTCSFTSVVKEHLDVVRTCIQEAKSQDPPIETIILDVRENGGGYLFYLENMLYLLSRRFWFADNGEVLLSTVFNRGASESVRMTPTSGSHPQGAFAFSLSENAAKNHYPAILEMYLKGQDIFDAKEGNLMLSWQHPDIFLNALPMQRAEGAPIRFVTKKLSTVAPPYNFFTQCPAVANDKMPTSGFTRIGILSLGYCVSACSRFLHMFKTTNAGVSVTAGGLASGNAIHTTSSSPNGPVFRWNNFVDVNNGLRTTRNLTKITKTNGFISFPIASYYSNIDNAFDDEYNLTHSLPDLSVDLWPPFDGAKEKVLIGRAVNLLSGDDYNTEASGWTDSFKFNEAAKFTVDGEEACEPMRMLGGNTIQVFVPSLLESCYERVSGNIRKEEVMEVIEALEQVAGFYPGTDIAASDDTSIVGRVDLVPILDALRDSHPASRYGFHKNVSRLISELKDNHFSYSIPTEFAGEVHSMVQFTSFLVDGVQKLQLKGFTDLASQLWTEEERNAGFQPGVTIHLINGVDAVQFLADLAFSNQRFQTRDQAFNNILRQPNMVFGRGGETVLNSFEVQYETEGGAQETITVPFFILKAVSPELQAQLLEQDDSSEFQSKLLSAVFPQQQQQRSAKVLGAQEYWQRDDVEVLAQYPEGKTPDIVCAKSQADGITHMYLYIGTFYFEASPDICNISMNAKYRLDVARECISHANEVETLVLDVRQNGGGYLLYLENLLFLLSRHFWFGDNGEQLESAYFKRGPNEGIKISPASMSYPQGAFEFAMSEEMIANNYETIVQLYLGSELFDVNSGESLLDPSTLFQQAETRQRVVGAPPRRVTKKVSMLGLPLGIGVSKMCPSLRGETMPTQGFKRIAILSLGYCVSACSRFLHSFKYFNAALSVTAGGLTGNEVHTTSSSPNGPVFEWPDFVKTNNRLSTTKNLTAITMSDARLRFPISSFFTNIDNVLDDEYNMTQSLPDHTINLWPPFDGDTEKTIITEAVKIVNGASYDTSASGWEDFKFAEVTTYKTPDSGSSKVWIVIVAVVSAVLALVIGYGVVTRLSKRSPRYVEVGEEEARIAPGESLRYASDRHENI